MLWAIISLWLSSYVVKSDDGCPLLGTSPQVNVGNNNYVVDFFGGILVFAYGVDQCTALDVVPGADHALYQCNYDSSSDSWSVTKSTYGNSDCSGTAKKTTIFSEGDAWPGYPGSFNCGGENTYAEVEISAFGDCSHAQTIFAGLGACLYNRPLLTQFYCDDSNAFVQFYLNSTYYPETNGTGVSEAPYEECDALLYCRRWSFTHSCGTIGTVQGATIYGKIDTCLSSLVVETTGSQSTTSGSPVISFSLFTIIFSVVLLFVAL